MKRLKRLLDVQEIIRWLTVRCGHCGYRFHWGPKDPRNAFNPSGPVYHNSCISSIMWRNKAEEAYDVLAVVSEVSGLGEEDIKLVVELRNEIPYERSAESDKVFRVFMHMNRRMASKWPKTRKGTEDGSDSQS